MSASQESMQFHRKLKRRFALPRDTHMFCRGASAKHRKRKKQVRELFYIYGHRHNLSMKIRFFNVNDYPITFPLNSNNNRYIVSISNKLLPTDNQAPDELKVQQKAHSPFHVFRFLECRAN